LSIIAYPISVTSNHIHDLVETASAFGSAGVFVTALFALFTRLGGPLSAYASIVSGMLVWAVGKYLASPAPYDGTVGCHRRLCAPRPARGGACAARDVAGATIACIATAPRHNQWMHAMARPRG